MKKFILLLSFLCVQIVTAITWQEKNSNAIPAIVIKQPTSLPFYMASTNFIDLGGAFISTNSIEKIVWKNSLGGEGFCEVIQNSNKWHKHSLQIFEGTNIITVTLNESHSNKASDFIAILYNTTSAPDTNPPSLNIIQPSDWIETNSTMVEILGTADDDSGYVAVTVNNVLAGTNIWARKVKLENKTNVFNITAFDLSTNSTTKLLHIIFSENIDTNPPVITVIQPSDWSETTASNVLVYGTAYDDSQVIAVKVNNEFAGTTNWAKQVSLSFGTNVINIFAYDSFHNVSTVEVSVVRVNERLIITTTSDELVGVSGETYIRKLETNKEDDDTDLWTIRGIPSDSGLMPTVDGLIQGVPTVEGEFPITAQVTDTASGETTSTNLIITIQAQVTNTIINNATVDGIVNEPYSASVQLVGGNHGDDVEFYAPDGMPPGIALSEDGHIHGVPSAVGSYEIPIVVSNMNDSFAMRLMMMMTGKKTKVFFNIVDNTHDSLQDFNIKKTTIKIDNKNQNKDKLTSVFSFLAPEENFVLSNYNWTVNLGNYPITLNIIKSFKNGNGIKFSNSPDEKNKLSIKGKAVAKKSGEINVIIKVKNARLADVYNLEDGNVPSIKYLPMQFTVGENSGHLILPMSGKEKNKIVLKLRK